MHSALCAGSKVVLLTNYIHSWAVHCLVTRPDDWLLFSSWTERVACQISLHSSPSLPAFCVAIKRAHLRKKVYCGSAHCAKSWRQILRLWQLRQIVTQPQADGSHESVGKMNRLLEVGSNDCLCTSVFDDALRGTSRLHLGTPEGMIIHGIIFSACSHVHLHTSDIILCFSPGVPTASQGYPMCPYITRDDLGPSPKWPRP